MIYRISFELKNNLIFLLVACTFLLNSSSFSNYIIFTLLFLSFLANFKNINKYKIHKYLLFISLLLSVLVGTLLSNNEVDYLRIGSLLIIFFSFPYQFNFNVNHYKLLIVIALYLFVLQVGNGLNIGFISNYISSYYPIEENVWRYGELKSVADLVTTRFAGVFYNPNIMGQNMVLLFCFLLKYLKSEHHRKIIKIIVWSLFFVSILLAGGRTAMITFLIINFFAFRKRITKKSLVFGIPLLLFGGLFYLPKLDKLISNFRVFNINAIFSSQGSGSIKLNILTDWLSQLFIDSNFNIFQVLFGIGSIHTQFDFDIGYLLQMFGFLGFAVLLGFLIKIYHQSISSYRFIFFVFFISIGATLIINFRFSVLIFAILSMYNYKNKLSDE